MTNITPIKSLVLYDHPPGRFDMPDGSTPYIYVVLGGALRLHTPSGILDYATEQYSVSAIDTPTSGYVLATDNDGVMRAASLSFTLDEVLSVVLPIENDMAQQIIDGRMADQDMEQADRRVTESVERLIEIAEDSVQRSFLAQHIKREVIFHVLCGSMGRQFLQAVLGIRVSGDIYELNSWIKENYRQNISVPELAYRMNMSTSALHQKFKKAVGMGLLQCQKRLRLTEARRLMLDEDCNVGEASGKVGYESVQQFIREYKKMFGRSPKDDILFLKERLMPTEL